VKLGIESLLKDPSLIKGRRVGIILNAASRDAKGRLSVDLIYEYGGAKVSAVFGPQQGFFGETQDNMVEWDSSTYPPYNIPLYSLYGKTRKPTIEMLEGIDVLIFDVQDVGCRVYTYIWTMALAMEAAREADKEFIVLDRPNPIGGECMEGPLLEPEFSSFVGLYPLPFRHGMTVGEIARYLNEEWRIGARLTVIPMEGWKRGLWFEETGLTWYPTSANMPTLDTVNIYPVTVALEGTNISEGRGTTRPFEIIGAPFIDEYALSKELKGMGLHWVSFIPWRFIPMFQKHGGRECGGIFLVINDKRRLRTFETAISIISSIRRLYPRQFAWKEPPYEYIFDKPPIDVIFGTDKIRRWLEEEVPAQEIVREAEKPLREFARIRKRYELYC